MRRFLLSFLLVSAGLQLNAQNPLDIANCDFESPVINCDFSFDPLQQNLWKTGTPQKPFFGNAWSAPNAIQTDTINSYPASSNSAFILKFNNNVEPATDWNLTSLSFWHKYQTDPLEDFGEIFYSLDQGLSWIPMTDTFGITGSGGYSYTDFHWAAYLMEAPVSSVAANRVTGISSDWVYAEYVWTWFNPVEGPRNFTPDTMYVKFVFNSDSIFDSYDGWIIDNISVKKTFWSGVDPGNSADALQLYPNPATGYFNYALVSNEMPQVQQLINLKGQVVKEWNVHARQGTLMLNELPKGNYLFKVITREGHFSLQRILLQ